MVLRPLSKSWYHYQEHPRQLHGFATNDAVRQNVLPANTIQTSKCIQEKTLKMYGKSVLQAVCVLNMSPAWNRLFNLTTCHLHSLHSFHFPWGWPAWHREPSAWTPDRIPSPNSMVARCGSWLTIDLHHPSSSFIILHQNHQTACLLHGHQRSWACGRDPDFIRECNATRPPKICGFERVFYRNILCGFSSLIIWKIKVLERCIVFGVLILSSILGCLLFVALLVFDRWS